ncbi:hypothetical protein BCV69DRAFT_279792 [Microstroma glucosiphilum]|uniref:Uncharacterized protein n=1 Tax=Pseudomicrostroma glucosiphilum TaxID=1684307 RepID=A0A316UIW2_9BASI|nr:hypothetical protein BCV69DRAFT_279792 [Pseudomicrostroma glucosiphilum]PWN23883.1 hypothetical protein BCV69DRAFT_279792 [Pseudomicrostroma glucosiphilum]
MSDKSHTLMHMSSADQHNHGGPEPEEKRPSHEQGVENSHQNLDAKDEKSIANKLDQASKQEKREKKAEQEDNSMPTDAARNHGNEPSKGAKIDEQIELEEQAELRKKGIQP